LEQQDFALTSSLLEIGSEDLVKSLLMVFDGAGQVIQPFGCSIDLH